MQASKPLFAIVISEKGGAERREVFDRLELSVGRVQGNDLMLPKGNVSKRHARLVYRDGRFIVSDLNSTNGTYVNRRRISQATIVREGDRIYIGDFVLRVELPEGSPPPSSAPEEAAGEPSSSSLPTDGSTRPIEATPAEKQQPYPELPRPPRVPTAAGGAKPLVPAGLEPASGRQPLPSPLRADRSAVERLAPERTPAQASTLDRGFLFPDDTSGTAEARPHRAAFVGLASRVLAALPSGSLEQTDDERIAQSVEQLLQEQTQAMQGQGLLPRTLNAERLSAEVRAEVLDWGPLRALLDDAEVGQIVVSRFDRVEALRGGALTVVQPGFSSEQALRRVIARVLRDCGCGELSSGVVEAARLPSGASVSAVLGSGAASSALIINKPREVSVTLEQLVRSGAISRAIATFLQQTVLARLNVLIVGSRNASATPVLSALCGASGERLVVSEPLLDAVAQHRAPVVPLRLGELQLDVGRILQVYAQLPDSRLVLGLESASVTAAVVGSAADRGAGMFAVASGPGLRRTLARLAAELAVERSGTSTAACREWLAGSFDVVIEVARLRDGRERVTRVCELAPTSEQDFQVADIFTFVPDRTAAGGTIEGSFSSSGVVPRVVEEMIARGYSIDSSLFNRPASR